jgi:hypothetical protein
VERDKTLVIADLPSLELWRKRLRNIVGPRALYPVKFELPMFSAQYNHNLSALARGLQKSCGCASGGFFTSMTFASLTAWFFLSGHAFSSITFSHLKFLAGYTILAALGGKLVGLAWARWRLLRLAAKTQAMASRIQEPSVQSEMGA